jgi:hypothetical protein
MGNRLDSLARRGFGSAQTMVWRTQVVTSLACSTDPARVAPAWRNGLDPVGHAGVGRDAVSSRVAVREVAVSFDRQCADEVPSARRPYFLRWSVIPRGCRCLGAPGPGWAAEGCSGKRTPSTPRPSQNRWPRRRFVQGPVKPDSTPEGEHAGLLADVRHTRSTDRATAGSSPPHQIARKSGSVRWGAARVS